MGAEDTTPTGRLSISEEKLQLALANMELRLRIYFDEQLKQKAEKTAVDINTATLAELRRGDFPPSVKRSIEEVVDDRIDARADSGWTSRQRVFGVVAIAVAILSLIVTVYAVASTRPSPAPSIHHGAPALVQEVPHD